MVIMEMLLLSVCGLLRVYLKTKKLANIPQSQAPRLFTQNSAVAAETGWIFDFSAARKGYSLFTV
jgi:hypothetical protein